MALFDRLREILRGFGARFGIGNKSLEDAQKASNLVLERWAELADRNFRTTRNAYKDAMRVDVEPGGITLRLETRFANMLEFGAPPWDLRRTLLRQEGSPWPKRNKNGVLYRPIFFRQSSAQIQQRGGWAAYRKHAISLKPSIRRVGQATQWGGRMNLPDIPKLKPHHAVDPLRGMYRMKEGPGGRSYYGTFRTISWGSKPWMHPGFKGKFLMKQAIKGLGRNVIAKLRRG